MMRTLPRPVMIASLALALVAGLGRVDGQEARRLRARELGVSALIGGQPGALDAITDVTGIEVGHTTLIEGEGRLVVGKGPVRTGVTGHPPTRKVELRSRVRRLVHARTATAR